MRVLILGGAGMLGHKIWQTLRERFDTWVTLRAPLDDYASLQLFDADRTLSGIDVTNLDSLVNTFARIRPEVVVNCVGIVKQLPSAKDPALSLTVNSLLPHRLASLSRATGARLVHVSTDCVFSGRRGLYEETDIADAEDLYGRTKLLGEPHFGDPGALTLRTSIIGRELRSTTGLTEWLLSQRGGTVRGFTTAVFSGLTTRALACIIGDVIERQPALAGLYHVSSAPITKYDLLTRINEAFGADITIEPSDAVSVDRSLKSDRFWEATQSQRPEWDCMIADLGADPTPYDHWRLGHVSR
jgi:dTDP-4-dehydrorhamnose reductase